MTDVLALEAGRARYPRPAWLSGMGAVIHPLTKPYPWGQFPEHEPPATGLKLGAAPHNFHLADADDSRGLPVIFILDRATDEVVFWPTPQGGEVVVPE